MKLKDWDEEEQYPEKSKQKHPGGKRMDGSGKGRAHRRADADSSPAADHGWGKEVDSEEEWEEIGLDLDGEDAESGFEADLGTEEWEDIFSDMDEEDGLQEEASPDWPQGGRQRSARGGLQEMAMSGQAPEEDERWEETEVDSKPGISYRWKKVALDAEPDEDGGQGEIPVQGLWRESGPEEAQERQRANVRQKSQGAYPGHGEKEFAKADDRGQGKEEDEGWEEELPPLKPWAKVLVFLGLAVVAAIICAFLWRFVHPEKPDGGEGQDSSVQATDASEDSTGQGLKPDLDTPGEGQTEGTGEPGTGADTEQPGTDGALDAGEGQPGTDGVSGTGQPGTDGASGTGQPGMDAASGEGEGQPGTDADSETNTDSEPGAGTAPGPGAGAGTESEPESPGKEQEPVAGTEGMTFQAVQESVTPKDVVNLRLVPTTADADNIVTQVRNGETLARIGINPDTGWSKIDYNGQTLYAVSQYLTTDLSYKPAVQPSDPNRVSTISGRVIIFKNCDDWISPKEYVNLRTEPSTTEGDATVSCQLNYGEKVHRTGYSTDSGWSRVEYNGQVLYVVTSLMYEVPAE